MKPRSINLRENPSYDDDDWHFTVPTELLSPAFRKTRMLQLALTGNGIILDTDRISSNRILHADDQSKFILLTLQRTFRFLDHPARSVTEYLNRMFKAGVFLNNVQYRFYHHSNSQLRGRSCFLREANSDRELDERIYAMGDYGRIMNVAKRAKRIGLLFSSADIDLQLDPKFVKDIPGIEIGGILGKKNRGREDSSTKVLAEFRKSMKKFNTSADHSFSVVGYSKPFSFGRLNSDIVVLLSSLGVSNDKLRAKQQEYFRWIAEASEEPTAAVDFLSCLDKYPSAEKVLLRGLGDADVLKEVRKYQLEDLSKHHDPETKKYKTRMMIHKSRRLFGVCDPFQVLKEGQVHIRITTERTGPVTPIHADVLVVRNPCLHPGDVLKLRAVDHPQLSHLVDCIVFSTVAKPGHRAAPAMSSGGDLDGDEFFVCWDPDLVPPHVSESYDYPANKERKNKEVTRADLANHFASYNSSGVAKVSRLHNMWAVSSPKGALCVECQELNVLHSQSVDGAVIKIPDRLQHPPEPTEPFILQLLQEDEETFEAEFRTSRVHLQDIMALDAEHAQQQVEKLFKSNQKALSEFELFNMALRLSRVHKFDLRPFLPQIDMSALSAMEKQIVSTTLQLSAIDYPHIWNSLFQSDILSPADLRLRGLDSSFSLQKLYSSRTSSQATFFEYLRRATQDYTRKLLLIKTDERFAVGIFMRGSIPWDEEPEVNENVVVVSFMCQSSAVPPTQRPCSKGFRLHCSYSRFQLYNGHVGDTFVFVNRAPSEHKADVVTSIALGKFSTTLQRQMGRLNRAPALDIELHVVSNHDRVAHDLFDLWYEHVPTEEYIPRFVRRSTPYRINDLKDVDWEQIDPIQEGLEGEVLERARRTWLEEIRVMALIKSVFYPYLEDMKLPSSKTRRQHSDVSIQPVLLTATRQDLDRIMEFSIQYHSEYEAFLVFYYSISQEPLDIDFASKWIERCPSLVFSLLRKFPPGDDLNLPDELSTSGSAVIQAIIRSANETRIAALVALEKLAFSIAGLSLKQYIELLTLVSLSVRSAQLVQEILFIMHESRLNYLPQPLSLANAYVHKHSLSIVFDRAEEAADECPCNEDGQPRKQREAPTQVKLEFVASEASTVKAAIRLDARSMPRLHSHVRLRAVSKAENRWIIPAVLDGLVVQGTRGEYQIKLVHPAPPELQQMDWNIYDAGSIATSQAMLDALLKLMLEKESCCQFYSTIIGDRDPDEANRGEVDENNDLQGTQVADGMSASEQEPERVVEDEVEDQDGVPAARAPDMFIEPADIILPPSDGLNESQRHAVASWASPLSLIWGPPGTGKTTVVVQILRSILLTYHEGRPRILMTASTHNAVDNVLERFIQINSSEQLLSEEQILRVATDQSRVHEDLLPFTIDARVGGDVNQNQRLLKKAEARVKNAILVFTTCAGAGLGILRKFDFDISIIDEASQITEPCTLIPLVKGIKKAIMVGDHVQLRPTVRKLGKALDSDVSLLERLYGQEDMPGMTKTMLDVQYRSPRVLNAFPSREFYQDRLKTAEQNESKLALLEALAFPWPKVNDLIIPTVFVPCSAEEDMGGRSKTNDGQIEAVLQVIQKLKPKVENEAQPPVGITVLSPYRGQIQKLRNRLPSSVPASTIDAFQGRESDIIIFSTVRCNAEGDIGFLEDARRLNVMWTRARLALIIIGSRVTLSHNELWKRALDSCEEIDLKDLTEGQESL